MRCLGAHALGLTVDWRYCFVPPGERAATTPGVVYMDVGGAVAPGIIDHHVGEGPGTCSAMLVVERRELVYNHLLAPWLARFEEGRIPADAVWAPTLILHHDPDFDALVAAFLVHELIATGDLPRYARALAGYALEVDQGRYPLRVRVSGEPEEDTLDFDRRELDAIHLAYLAIQSFIEPGGRELSSSEKLGLGMELLHCVLDGITSALGDSPRALEDLLPGAPGVGCWRSEERFAPFAQLLDRDLDLFREDFRQGRVLDEVPLPASDGGEAIRVSAFVAAGPPRSVLGKYWVRGAGFPFFLCPLSFAATPGSALRSTRRRFVLSLDPTFAVDGRKPHLRGLGFRLEQAESALRRAAGTEVRRGTPRYGGGYCDNPDPWYDGRGHEWTIVDSPLVGTMLPSDDIVALATGGDFWKVPLVGGRVTLIWTVAEPESTAGGPPLPIGGLRPFAGMSETLAMLYRESREETLRADGSTADPLAAGFRRTERWRRFPAGTCRPLRIVEITGEAGASLEDLVRHRHEVLDGRIPDFSLAHVCPGLHFSAPERIDRLLDELGGSGLRPLAGLAPSAERVLFNSRTLVTFNGSAEPAGGSDSDPDLEILLYGAFLYKTLIRFSERLSDLVPPGRSRLIPGGSARRVREDFLRFQARYFQLEVSRVARARVLFREIAAALGLSGLLAKVRSELDRLAEIEERIAAERQQRAEGVIQGALFLLAISGLLQTIVAFLAWKGGGWPVFWGVGFPIVAAFLGVFLWARFRAGTGQPPTGDSGGA